jgi:hypothetical protein
MNAAEWANCTDPLKMLSYLSDSGRTTERKLRLFAVGCCRGVWHLLRDERSQEAVKVAERYAEGAASEEALAAARKAVPMLVGASMDISYPDWAAIATASNRGPRDYVYGQHRDALGVGGAYAAAVQAADYAVRGTAFVPGADEEVVRSHETARQAALLRCIFGRLPFRPVSIAPSLLAWSDALVPGLARSGYDERQLPSGHLHPARLAILADALEDARCDDAELLRHLRGPGPHVRGCWGIDLLSGRE